MTGFLQRLAERATGAAHPLRAVSSTPFARTLLEEVSQPFDAMAAADVEVAPSMVGQEWAKTVQPGRNRTQRDSDRSPDRSKASSADREHLVDYTVAVDRRVAIGKSGGTTVSQPESMVPPTIMPHAPVAMPIPAIESTMRTESPFHAHQEVSLEPPESLRPAPAAIVRVEPLLPRAQPARERFRPTASASTDNLGRSSAGMVEETTEVHVSIGRIEVTAVHEPAPPKPAVSRRSAPMSLDDYLAKRHGSPT